MDAGYQVTVERSTQRIFDGESEKMFPDSFSAPIANRTGFVADKEFEQVIF